jgi:hypothetical protein
MERVSVRSTVVSFVSGTYPCGCMHRDGVVACLMVALTAAGCGESSPPPGGARTYRGDFECTEIDGDIALLVWDARARAGSFGWVPSSSPTGAFVTMPIPSLKFEVVFTDVLGLDVPQVAETVTLKLDLTLSDEGRKVDGPGTLTRANGTKESCNAELREAPTSDGGGLG